jgi:hypothetical protein
VLAIIVSALTQGPYQPPMAPVVTTVSAPAPQSNPERGCVALLDAREMEFAIVNKMAACSLLGLKIGYQRANGHLHGFLNGLENAAKKLKGLSAASR